MNKVTFASIRPSRWKRYASYFTLGILFVVFYCYRECMTHGSELAAFTTIENQIKQNRWPTVTGAFLLSLTVVGFMVTLLHETCHYLAIPNCRANGSFKFHWKTFTPSVGCHTPLSKLRYIIAALAPLVIVTPLAIIIYCMNDDIFVRTFALSVTLINTIGSANDLFTAKYVYSSQYTSFLEDHQYLVES